MNTRLGNNEFGGVEIPLLWGTRAVFPDSEGHLSIIDLGGRDAKLEIILDKLAPDIEFIPTSDGSSIILAAHKKLYSYNPSVKRLSNISLNLPDCEIDNDSIRVRGLYISGNIVVGGAVGLKIDENDVVMATDLPPGLANLPELTFLRQSSGHLGSHIATERSGLHSGTLDQGSAFISPRPGEAVRKTNKD
jgi:hypothetical protein